jgi:type IV secretion system protein VirB9
MQVPGLGGAPALVLAALTTQVASPARVLNERLQARPQVLNSHYTVSEGAASQDIVPTMVFDDGRFTYLKFPGNREVPAVFQVQADGSEALLNTRMDEDLLVVDRVSRKLVLRAGQAVVGVHNEAFDVDGIPPEDGTTVPGVRRVMRDGPARPGGPLNARGARP